MQADHCDEAARMDRAVALTQRRPLVAGVGVSRPPGRADGVAGVRPPALGGVLLSVRCAEIGPVGSISETGRSANMPTEGRCSGRCFGHGGAAPRSSGRSSEVEHQLSKLRRWGSIPAARSFLASAASRSSSAYPLEPWTGCPSPGTSSPPSAPQPGRCFRMVQSVQLQATHCRQEPAWKGVWRDRAGRSWYVEACREHAPRVTRTYRGD